MSTSNSVYEIRNGEGIIPVGTKKVVANAFRDCQDLLSVKIPEGVTSIGTGAFKGCTSLTDLSLPSTLEFIDDDAFERCESLTRVELPKSTKSISYISFYNARIDELVLPFSTPSVEQINVLNGPSAIRKIVIPNGSLNAYVRAIKIRFSGDLCSDFRKGLCNALVEEGGLTLKAIEESSIAEARKVREEQIAKEEKKEKRGQIIFVIVLVVLFIIAWLIRGY